MRTSPRQVVVGQSKRHRLINEVETDLHPSQRSLQHGSGYSGEKSRIRVQIPQKESRTGSCYGSREQPQQVDSPMLTHPGELVVCKKRRNDREKSVVMKPRTGPVSPTMRSPGPCSVTKDARLTQQNQGGWVGQPSQQPNGSGGSVGWANPVKRLRTDSGKRRPIHN